MSTTVHLKHPPQRRGGRMRGAEGYHMEDISALLRCVRAVIPTTTDEWDQVLNEYRHTHAVPNTRAQRDSTSLKTKFKQLLRKFKPNIDESPNVQEAAHVMNLIEIKMAKGKSQQRRGGRARGAEGFSSADVEALLNVVRRHLPLQRSEWEQVAQEYSKEYAARNGRAIRDGSSLKNKFRHWIKNDTTNMARVEVAKALVIQDEIAARLRKISQDVASNESEKEEIGGDNADEGGDGKANVIGPDVVSTVCSDGGDETPEPRRGGRALGSEGYFQSDLWALLACVRAVLPTGPASWEQTLQLYRSNYALPNNRAQRTLGGVKLKFRQLVHQKHDSKELLSKLVVEARAIQRAIDLHGRYRGRSHSEGNFSSSFPPDVSVPDNREELCTSSPRIETEINSSEQQSVKADKASWIKRFQNSLAGPVVQRQQHVISENELDSSCKSLRIEIANRELELLRQRGQRELEQAEWEKERTVREKQRMDMESWMLVCDRLRTLVRERAVEKNSDVVGQIEEELSVLKKKKQRLSKLLA